MKKSLIFVGMLAVGYANAQTDTEHLGKVGINTMTPKATLEVQPTATNLTGTTNEGIIAPKLSKERIAAIATPIEGTLVYATDEATSPISAYTGGDAKVAKITEKGYYFYNGTEWVKVSSDVVSQIWQKQSGNEIKLVDGDIAQNIQYMQNGGYESEIKNISSRTDYWWDSASKTVISGAFVENDYKNEGAFVKLKVFGDQLPAQKYGSYPFKYLSSSSLFLDGKEDTSVSRFANSNNLLRIEGNTAKNYSAVYANTNYSQHFGTGKVAMMIGSVNASQLFPNASATRMVGAYNEVSNKASSRVDVMEGSFNYLIAENTGFVQDAFGSRNQIHVRSTSTGTINWLEGLRNTLTIEEGYTGTINNYTGVKVFSPTIPNSVTGGITNMYGLVIQDVDKGKSLNYSIHTGVGKIRFGDLTGTGARLVVADADGVLGTSSIDITTATSKWTNDSINSLVKLSNLSDGATSRTDDKNIVITDEGRVGIGTTSPSEKLHVESSGNTKMAISSTTNGALAQLVVKNPNKEFAVGLHNENFLIYDNTNSKYRMIIDKNGKTIFSEIGGTPLARVDIRQNSGVDESVLSLATRSNTNNAISKGIQFYTDNPAYPARIDIVRGETSLQTGLAFLSSNSANPVEQMRITPAGNVGIGTTSPSEKLHVEGTVLAASFKGTNGATIFPDYVFQKYYTGTSSIKADYTFKTLSQVEDFVKTNGHLPGYKSAEAIKAQGYVDLMETQLTNVEKIEELYLHTIELKKENEGLKAKNQELEARLEKLEKLLK